MSDYCENANFRFPVIGILAIDILQRLQAVLSENNNYHSYLVASYAKYLEAAGAKVIPIWNNRSKSYYETMMSKINGILIPGGAIFFDKTQCKGNQTMDSFNSSKYIFDIAAELNHQGIHFPLWGTCLGLQLLIKHSIDKAEEVRRSCKFVKDSLPLKLVDEKVLRKSQLLGKLPEHLRNKMSQHPFGYHAHGFCITEEELKIHGIQDEWMVLATNEDQNGLEFISLIEHKDLPFFGSQFHPERVLFENSTPHDQCHRCFECFETNRYFGTFFVQQCMRNESHFESHAEELRHSLNNFPLTFTAPEKTMNWQQVYVFQSDVDYPIAKENEATNNED